MALRMSREGEVRFLEGQPPRRTLVQTIQDIMVSRGVVDENYDSHDHDFCKRKVKHYGADNVSPILEFHAGHLIKAIRASRKLRSLDALPEQMAHILNFAVPVLYDELTDLIKAGGVGAPSCWAVTRRRARLDVACVLY